MDFSDQIELGARLASAQPDVGVPERAKFKVVLLDEYQDTSVAQATMLSRLFSGPDAASGRGHAVTAVGDPNQAIYGWRGASVSNILDFPETFPAVRDGADLPAHRQPPVRPAHPRGRQPAGRAALRRARRGRAAGAQARGGRGRRHHARSSRPTATSWRRWSTGVRAAHPDDGSAWSDIGVLTRDNAHAAEVFDALTDAGIPVEIVGLSGLLRLPEVAEIVAILHLMHDVTANASLLTLLTGPRWAIGPRDLGLLSRRAAELAGRRGRGPAPASITAHLVADRRRHRPRRDPVPRRRAGRPGRARRTPRRRWSGSRCWRASCGCSASHVGEPLLDIVRRIIDTTGADVELASAVSPAAPARRDNLDLFVRAVADFQAVDGDVTLPALLAYLTAEDDQGNGLDIATPTAADSVKLLTVHRSKGLEWDSVFLVGVCETRFPCQPLPAAVDVVPAVSPGAAARRRQGPAPAAAATTRRRSTPTAPTPERTTAPRSSASATSPSPAPRTGCRSRPTAGARGPRRSARRHTRPSSATCSRVGRAGPTAGSTKPAKGDPNPYAAEDPSRPWPPTGPGAEAQRGSRPPRWCAPPTRTPRTTTSTWSRPPGSPTGTPSSSGCSPRRAPSAAPTIAVPLPASLSATALLRLHDDPEAFARELARPMPRPPSRAARFGTLFHAWVEDRFGQQPLLDPDDLPGRADPGIDDDADLDAIIESFEKGPFADRVPHAVEAPFALVLAGQVVRGRIDAVYDEPDGGFLLVDWKTNRHEDADPLQLALYRLAWAELRGVPLEKVRAAFHYVRTGTTVEPDDLPDRQRWRRCSLSRESRRGAVSAQPRQVVRGPYEVAD